MKKKYLLGKNMNGKKTGKYNLSFWYVLILLFLCFSHSQWSFTNELFRDEFWILMLTRTLNNIQIIFIVTRTENIKLFQLYQTQPFLSLGKATKESSQLKFHCRLKVAWSFLIETHFCIQYEKQKNLMKKRWKWKKKSWEKYFNSFHLF